VILTFFHKIKQIRAAFKSTKAVFEPLFLLYGVVTHTYLSTLLDGDRTRQQSFLFRATHYK